jgi:hypothetical protein
MDFTLEEVVVIEQAVANLKKEYKSNAESVVKRLVGSKQREEAEKASQQLQVIEDTLLKVGGLKTVLEEV